MKSRTKYIIDAWFLLGLVCLSGCTTGGLVIGPFSNLAAQSNERTMTIRALSAANIEPAKKQAAIKAMQWGGDPGAVVVGLSLDVTALMDNKYTITELVKSAGGAALDTALYGGVAWGAGKIANSLSNSNSGNGAITVNGNVVDSSISSVQGNSSSVVVSQSTATRTRTESK